MSQEKAEDEAVKAGSAAEDEKGAEDEAGKACSAAELADGPAGAADGGDDSAPSGRPRRLPQQRAQGNICVRHVLNQSTRAVVLACVGWLTQGRWASINTFWIPCIMTDYAHLP